MATPDKRVPTSYSGAIRLRTSQSEQGPIELDSFNPPTDTKESLNLVVAQFVVTRDVDLELFEALVRDTPAALLLVLFDPLRTGHGDAAQYEDCPRQLRKKAIVKALKATKH